MKDVFILRLKTKETNSVRGFKRLMANLGEPGEVLCSKERNLENQFEVIYLLPTERLLEIKNRIDSEINYDDLELFVFESW